jgi:hypothetical protein
MRQSLIHRLEYFREAPFHRLHQSERMDVSLTANARKDGKRQTATLAGLSPRDIAVRSARRQ